MLFWCSHIAATFGRSALKDITLYAKAAYFIISENGAGKSTLMKILAGVYPPTQDDNHGETIITNPHSRQLGRLFSELSPE